MFFSLSNTEQASPIKLLWQLVWLLPHFPLPPLPQSNKQVNWNRAHCMSLNSQVPQDDIFAAFVAGVEKSTGKKGRKWGKSFPFGSFLPPPPPPPPPPTTMKGCLRRFRRHLCIGDAPATAPFLAFFISPSSLPSESLEQAKDNHKVFRSN